MAFTHLDDFVTFLEGKGELVRVKQYVNPELEMTEIVDRLSKLGDGGKAVLFENTGTDFPVLMNMMGSEKRICMALNTSKLDDLGNEIESLFTSLAKPKKTLVDKFKMLPLLAKVSSWMPKSGKGKGTSQEVIHLEPRLSILPVLKCWPHDGGRFITFPMVITQDPTTGVRNVGMYRMQVIDETSTGMHWHKHKTGARHYQEYKKLGKQMPVAVALGGDPALTFSATAPLPDNIDEFMLAGFLRKKPVPMVRCITNELEVPADADIILEGYVDPQEDLLWEGPFGDHTGFYSLADWYPRFHVTCITHRKNAIYPATIVGIPPMEDAYIAKATERIFLTPIKLTMLPELTDMHMPFVGVAHNLVIARINKTYAGQGLKTMNALWGAGQMMFNKTLVVVDGEININDYLALAKHISGNINPRKDIYIGKGPLDVLDHSSAKFAFGGKLFIDATSKEEEEREELAPHHPLVNTTNLLELIPELSYCNDSLVKVNVSFVIFSIGNKSTGTIKHISTKIMESGYCSVKGMLFVDSSVEVQDLQTTLWVALNNIDPSRDIQICHEKNCVVLDGTRKTASTDNFERDWPNVVVSSEDTINSVDKQWSSLGLGKFIPSPSLKFRKMLWNEGAVSS